MNYPELNTLSNVLFLEGETFRCIKGFEGFYQISNLGRVKRLACVIPRGKFYLKYKEIILKANNDSRGYPQVTLNFNTRRVARVHRLVAEAFLEKPSQKLVDECKASGLDYVLVNHLDENSCNPNVSNLEWCSSARNNIYGKSRKGQKAVSGSANYCAILTEENVEDIIKLLKEGELKQWQIAKMFNVKQITVSNIWTGRSWSHFTGIPWKPRSSKTERKSTEPLYEQILT